MLVELYFILEIEPYKWLSFRNWFSIFSSHDPSLHSRNFLSRLDLLKHVDGIFELKIVLQIVVLWASYFTNNLIAILVIIMF